LQNADFQSIFARKASAIGLTPRKKVQLGLTLAGSPLRAFQ